VACSTPSFFSERERGTGGASDAGAGAGADTGDDSGAIGGGGTHTGGTAGSSTGGVANGGTSSGGSENGGRAGGAGATGGARPSGGSGGGALVAGSGSSATAGEGGGGAEGEPIRVDLSLSDDTDDAVWISSTDERLVYRDDEPFLEVGADFEMARAGFRFSLPLPSGAVVESARLYVMRITGEASASETMLVQVFDSASVPPFDDDHEHRPEEHDPHGLYRIGVFGFAVGRDGETVQSPELASLVQHVVDRDDYAEGGTLGFVLSADQLDSWVQFADRSETAGAKLSILYRTPR
jgi:hypothetical protein